MHHALHELQDGSTVPTGRGRRRTVDSMRDRHPARAVIAAATGARFRHNAGEIYNSIRNAGYTNIVVAGDVNDYPASATWTRS